MKKNSLMLLLLLISIFLISCSKENDNGNYIDPGTYFPQDEKDPLIKDSLGLNDNIFEGEDLDDSEKIRWIGRTQYQNNARFMYYTATGFEVRFIGTSLEATFSATNVSNISKQPYFSVFIDGDLSADSIVFHLSETKQIISLAIDLENTEHTIQVVKRSEPYDSITSITSIKTDGDFIKAQEKEGLKIQIIGASGISGHGALGDPGEARTTENSSSLHSFGYLTARMFNADYQFISNSGMGLKWGSGTNARTAYDYVGLDTNQRIIDEKWNHSSWIPDIVICNIGGNDFTSYVNRLDDQSEAKQEFREAVTELLSYIHSLYPNAIIIWTHTGSNNGSQAEAAISDYEKSSQVKVVVIPKVASDGDPQGANGHNSVYTHIRATNIIVEAITKITGIQPINENITWSEN